MQTKSDLLDKYIPASRTEINFESPNYNGKLDIKGYAVEAPYDDVILAEYIDETNGAIDDRGLMKVDLKSKVWRKARVLAVGPIVKARGQTKPGDLVLFPNDKGLQTGKLHYRAADGTVKETSSAIFLTEDKLVSGLSVLE